ncbi:MAG: HAD hydrolase-like protein [Verrucomicrobiota bacterium]
MTKLVLFDIDGTLVHTNGAGVEAFARVFATEFKVRHGAEDIRFAGRTDRSLLREFFREYGIAYTEGNLERFTESYFFWLDHLLRERGGGVFPGVLDWLGALRSRPEPPLLGLLTGNLRLGAEIKLRYFGLWEHFGLGAFADDHEDRNQLAVIARQRGSRLLGRELRGAEIAIIGDTPLDIACARAIGAKSLAVATGGHGLEELRAHQPTWAVEDLTRMAAGELG